MIVAIQATAKIILSWIFALYASNQNMIYALGSFLAVVAGVYFTREMATLLREQLNKRLGRPSLVRYTSKKTRVGEFLLCCRHALCCCMCRKRSGHEFDDVVLHKKLEDQVGLFRCGSIGGAENDFVPAIVFNQRKLCEREKRIIQSTSEAYAVSRVSEKFKASFCNPPTSFTYTPFAGMHSNIPSTEGSLGLETTTGGAQQRFRLLQIALFAALHFVPERGVALRGAALRGILLVAGALVFADQLLQVSPLLTERGCYTTIAPTTRPGPASCQQRLWDRAVAEPFSSDLLKIMILCPHFF